MVTLALLFKTLHDSAADDAEHVKPVQVRHGKVQDQHVALVRPRG
jgi:hypothetical protein